MDNAVYLLGRHMHAVHTAALQLYSEWASEPGSRSRRHRRRAEKAFDVKAQAIEETVCPSCESLSFM